jgi:hypothetical protein
VRTFIGLRQREQFGVRARSLDFGWSWTAICSTSTDPRDGTLNFDAALQTPIRHEISFATRNDHHAFVALAHLGQGGASGDTMR